MLFSIFGACGFKFPKNARFDYYQKDFILPKNSLLKINGVYGGIPIDSSRSKFSEKYKEIFFYKFNTDGSFETIGENSFFEENNPLDAYLMYENVKSWRSPCKGYYNIKGDTLFMEYVDFSYLQTSIFTQEKGVIKNDTIHIFSKGYEKQWLCFRNYPKKAKIYRKIMVFYPFSKKD